MLKINKIYSVIFIYSNVLLTASHLPEFKVFELAAIYMHDIYIYW